MEAPTAAPFKNAGTFSSGGTLKDRSPVVMVLGFKFVTSTIAVFLLNKPFPWYIQSEIHLY